MKLRVTASMTLVIVACLVTLATVSCTPSADPGPDVRTLYYCDCALTCWDGGVSTTEIRYVQACENSTFEAMVDSQSTCEERFGQFAPDDLECYCDTACMCDTEYEDCVRN